MNDDPQRRRVALEEFFSRAYADDSLPGKILRARRPNNSVEWDEEGDTQRITKNAKSFARQFRAAVERLTSVK